MDINIRTLNGRAVFLVFGSGFSSKDLDMLWIVLLSICGLIHVTSSSYSRQAAVSHFFDSLDGNQDGEIDENEARQFIGESLGGSDFDTSQKVDVALDRMKLNVDGGDPSTTISKAELNQHLKRLLQVSFITWWLCVNTMLISLSQIFR